MYLPIHAHSRASFQWDIQSILQFCLTEQSMLWGSQPIKSQIACRQLKIGWKKKRTLPCQLQELLPRQNWRRKVFLWLGLGFMYSKGYRKFDCFWMYIYCRVYKFKADLQTSVCKSRFVILICHAFLIGRCTFYCRLLRSQFIAGYWGRTSTKCGQGSNCFKQEKTLERFYR